MQVTRRSHTTNRPETSDRIADARGDLETVETAFEAIYSWNYGSVKDGLRDLYEKAKRDQWNGTVQLPWDTDVDPEARSYRRR